MNNKLCVGCLINIRDMFIVGSKQCEGEALEYHQRFISALNYAIKLIDSPERLQGEWIIIKDERYGDNVKCHFCGKELAGTDLNFCCKCGAKLVGSEKLNGGAE